jgi:predicted O-linked N-acetylglucosamine transferase (SPINDLY family)
MLQTYRDSIQTGIDLILQGQEQEAQMSWLYAVNDLGEAETEQFCLELAAALVQAAQNQENSNNWVQAWGLYRYACENVSSLENWLRSLQASLKAVATKSDEQLGLDWEALTQSIELLTEQKFVIAQELIPSLFESLQQLRHLYPDTEDKFSVDTCYYLGLLYRRELKIYAAIASFQKAINLAPEKLEIYESLIESLIILANSGSQKVYSDWRQVSEIYVDVCAKLGELNPQLSNSSFHLSSATHRIKSYLMSGMYTAAKAYFDQTETQIYKNAEYFTTKDWKSLYVGFLFFIPFLRDDPILNGRLFEFIADQYRKFCLTSFFNEYPQFQLIPKVSSISIDAPVFAPKRSLRIGIMSGLFRRHSVAWCSKDWLFELAKIAPDLKFYLTAQFEADDITQQYEKFGDRLYKVQATSESEQIAEITQKLIDDDLDILIELDAMMNHLHSPIMASKPAKHCISWAGFASPYLSQNNYFLGDRHFLPTEIESLYSNPK